jgi:hypothetical protein
MNESSTATHVSDPIVTLIHVVPVGFEDPDDLLESDVLEIQDVVEHDVEEMQDAVGPLSAPASSRLEWTDHGVRVIHCAQWHSRRALEVAIGVPTARARMEAIQRIADDHPNLCEWATFEEP